LHAQAQIDPLVNFRNSAGDAVHGTILHVQRTSLAMEIYKPDAVGQLSELLTELTIRIGITPLYSGKAIVTSLVNTGLTAVVSVSLIDDWHELGAIVIAPAAARQAAQDFVRQWSDNSRIEARYQVVVNEMRTFLADAARWVGQIDLSDSLPRENGQLRDDVFYELAAPLIEKTQYYFAALEREAARIAADAAPPHRAYAQAALHPLLLGAPFVFRTFAKPLGYAGDYQMVNQIVGEPRQGPNTYFQMVNVAFLQTAVALAHRNRIDMLAGFLARLADAAKLAGRPFRVLNVGCGPAIEIERFLQTYQQPEWLSFELMDFNAETLNWTRDKLTRIQRTLNTQVQIDYVQDSVHHMLKRRTDDTPPTNEFDAVYCAGLFDYLSDKVCKRLMLHFAARMHAGSQLLVTNVHASNPVRFDMEHLTEWYLIYRDETQFQALLPARCINSTIYVDATGVNIFAEMTIF
jgi:extracellular factor (EF) 3-hydroxypalmitic acid methyl ester biosynthesis protein